jgi:ATP-dependent HslUV protease ATP-binding subunit HslU
VTELTPAGIVKELDKYIVGQKAAKSAVAIAVRNRWRRLQLDPEMREEVLPKNIIMIGPTGVGKTEIARRMAALVHGPFLKVEASRYTEVGYRGKDVESVVRDLVELSVGMVRAERVAAVQAEAERVAEERLLDMLLPGPDSEALTEEGHERRQGTREKLRQKLCSGELKDRQVEIASEEKAVIAQAMIPGAEEIGFDLQNVLETMLPSRRRVHRVTVSEAMNLLIQQEADKLIDRETVAAEGKRRAENSGIIFIDELDKIAASYTESYGPDVSREGVQRDLLPIVEGTTVATRYGVVRTDHILFIAAGAFHMTKPSDLIPELQGRFPIRVELDSLGREEFVRILTEPKNALTRQYQALLATEGISIHFARDAVEEIAAIAAEINSRGQNIGARRLQTVMEKLLEDISFEAPDLKEKQIEMTAAYVRERLQDIITDVDLSRYIL